MSDCTMIPHTLSQPWLTTSLQNQGCKRSVWWLPRLEQQPHHKICPYRSSHSTISRPQHTCACRIGEETATSGGCPALTGNSTTATLDKSPWSWNFSMSSRPVTSLVRALGEAGAPTEWPKGRRRTRGVGGSIGFASSSRASLSRAASHGTWKTNSGLVSVNQCIFLAMCQVKHT